MMADLTHKFKSRATLTVLALIIMLGCGSLRLDIPFSTKLQMGLNPKAVGKNVNPASPAVLRIPINYENNARWSEAIEEVVLTIIKGDVPYYFLHLKSYLGVLQRRSL